MNKNKRKIISILIIVIVIIIGFLMVTIKKLMQKEEKLSEVVGYEQDQELETEKVDNISYYFAIEKYIGEYVYMTSQEDSNNYIYSILDESYINKNSISKEKIYSNITKFSEDSMVYIRKMYCQKINNSINAFYVYCDVIKENNEKSEKMYIATLVDSNNESFSVIPLSKEEYSKIINKESNLNISKEAINKNPYNDFYLEQFIQEKICIAVFNDYKYKIDKLKDAEIQEFIDEAEKTEDHIKYKFVDNYNNNYTIDVLKKVDINEEISLLLQYKLDSK